MECIWEIGGTAQSCNMVIMYGLIFDIIGAGLIAIPLWNSRRRAKEEFDLEVSKKERLEEKKNESINMRNHNKKIDDTIDVLAEFSNMFMRGIWASKDQRWVRIGITFLIFGFLVQIAGNWLQHLNFIENYV